MKNYLAILFLLLIEFSFAQGIAYQATVLNPETQLPGGNSDLIPLANASICMEFTVVDYSNAIEYTERHQTTTSDYGRVDLIIGNGQSNGSFSNINWNGSKKSLIVRIDYGGTCSNFEAFSQSEFNYVPYALYALNSITSVDLSNNSTDDISEGTNNLYYSDTRAQAAISGGTGVNVDAGVISIGQSVNTTDDVSFNSVTGNVEGTVSDLSNHTTDNLAEGTNNLYYSDAKVQAAFTAGTGVSLTGGTFSIGQSVNTTDDVTFNSVSANITGNVTGNVVGTVSDLSNHDTDDLAEGTTNKYYTDARAKAAISGGNGVDVTNGVVSIGQSVNTTDDVSFNKVTSNVTGNLTGNVLGTVSDLSNHDTDDLAEGTANKYYTDARAKAAISGGTGVTVTNGVVTIGQSVNTTDEVSFNKVTSNVTGNLTGNVVGTVSNLSNHDTDDLAEGTSNLYYTDDRAKAAISGGLGVTVTSGSVAIGQAVGTSNNVTFNSVTANLTGNVTGTVSDLSNHDTDDLAEGTTNKYYTDTRAQAAISGGVGVTVTSGSVAIGQAVGTSNDVTFNSVTANLTGNVTGTVSDLSNHDTDDLAEGTTNKYYTDTRAQAAITGGVGVTVTSGSVAIGQPVGTSDTVTFTTVNANLNGNVTGNVVGTVTGTVSSLSNHDTDDLSEGTTNLYYTNDRVYTALTGGLGVGVSSGTISIGQAVEPTSTVTFTTVNANLNGNVTGNVVGTVTGTVSSLSNHDTDDLAEGATNKYYTDDRVYNALTGGLGVGVSSGTISIGQDVSETASVTFNTVSATIKTNSIQLGGTTITSNATELNLLDGATSTGINSKGSLGLFTGVYSTTISGASSITIPYINILTGGETPTTNSMVMFYSNTASGPIITEAYLADTNIDTINDSFKINFTASWSGNLILSYFIAL
jgi:hypothetical protein